MAEDDVIQNLGEAAQVERRANALVALLRDDPKFLDFYNQWIELLEEDCTDVHSVIATGAVIEGRIKALVAELGLPAWVAARMFNDMKAVIATGTVSGELEWPPFPPEVLEVLTAERSRQPNKRDDVTRHVEWYYRVKVKGEAKNAIAKEWSESQGNGRPGKPNVSVVQYAINTTDALLRKLDVGPRAPR